MLTRILTVISAVFGVPVFINGATLIASGANNIGTYLTVLFGLILIIIAIFMKMIRKLIIYPVFKLLGTVLISLCVLAFISSVFLFTYGKADTATYNEDYLIVLGCGLNGTEPSQMLINRLEEAVEYADKNESCKIIVTGGMGPGEDIPEAKAMHDYLVSKGISSNRIMQENKATSTTENFQLTNELTDKDLQSKTAVFITNDFHVYRASSLARLQGLSINHLNAPTPLNCIIPSYLRENLALIQMVVFNK